MTKRELKGEIAKVFNVPIPEGKKSFIRTFERKRISTKAFITGQIRFIDKRVWIISALILIPVLFGAYSAGTDIVWAVSSFVPVLALLLITEISKSITHGMNELEMSSRFSLKSIVSARILILGVFDMLLFCIIIPVCRMVDNISFIQTGLYLFVPFLLTAFLGMKIVRYFHNKETVYWCTGAAVLVSSINIMLRYIAAYVFSADNLIWWIIVALILVFAEIKEIYIIFRKAEEMLWSFVLTD